VTGNVPQGLFGLESTNNLYGPGKHPYKPNSYSCGGSSGGVAGLVSKNCVPLGVASDSAGSIRFPAATCGIVGFMPTSTRISKKGRVGISGSEIEGLKELLPSIGRYNLNIFTIYLCFILMKNYL
jgi:Asp-tRNA(Asn)/Glu-tRNA(Gln) amidotransferase A subunit family amidase